MIFLQYYSWSRFSWLPASSKYFQLSSSGAAAPMLCGTLGIYISHRIKITWTYKSKRVQVKMTCVLKASVLVWFGFWWCCFFPHIKAVSEINDRNNTIIPYTAQLPSTSNNSRGSLFI